MQSYRSLFSTIFFSCFLMILIVQGEHLLFASNEDSFALTILGAKRDICPWIYCENNGTCIQRENSTIGFECRCQFSFVGLLCENRVNITSKEYPLSY